MSAGSLMLDRCIDVLEKQRPGPVDGIKAEAYMLIKFVDKAAGQVVNGGKIFFQNTSSLGRSIQLCHMRNLLTCHSAQELLLHKGPATTKAASAWAVTAAAAATIPTAVPMRQIAEAVVARRMRRILERELVLEVEEATARVGEVVGVRGRERVVVAVELEEDVQGATALGLVQAD
ncbi:hypothetical protein M0R45_019562 [Rubus argutus]|uniref:Uncharacterized protein n=1 Tax=Rubus argutus TaxID=59490 RepID=A0AAW1X7P7_RUBAR